MKTLFAILLCAFSSAVLAETFTATWDHANPANVERYNNQYDFDNSFASPNFLGGTTGMSRTFDADVTGKAQICFRVRASNEHGVSDWAAICKSLVTSAIPSIPINLVIN